MLLPLHSKLPEAAKIGHTFQQWSSNLFSIPQLIDSVKDCTCTFTKNAVTCTDGNRETIIKGDRDHTTGLWEIPIGIQNDETQTTPTADDDATIITSNKTSDKIPTPTSMTLNDERPPDKVRIWGKALSAYRQRNAAELAAWHHATLGAPPERTLLSTIKKGFLTTFPGLTEATLKHLPKSEQTTMGHMKRIAQRF